MTDYTPTTAEIADWYAHKGDSTAAPYYASKLTKRVNEFDRWLAEHDRQVAERAWDRCVGEMPIDPDWKNFYSDQNPYRAAKGEGDE